MEPGRVGTGSWLCSQLIVTAYPQNQSLAKLKLQDAKTRTGSSRSPPTKVVMQGAT